MATDPGAVYPALVQSNTGPAGYVPAFRLPGWGEAKATCGVTVRGLRCRVAAGRATQGRLPRDVKHLERVVVATCGRSACPQCFPTWAMRAAQRAADRLAAGRELYAREGVHLAEARHVVFSPPQEWAVGLLAQGRKGLAKLWREAIKTILASGFKGGAIVFHAYRIRKGGDGKSVVRGNGKYRRAEADGLLVLSPHFHAMGYGRIQNAREFHAETGWTYKNRGDRLTEKERVGTVAYLLDHVALLGDGGHALRWFGLFGYRKFGVEKETSEREPLKCECGEDCEKYPSPIVARDGTVKDWGEPRGVYMAVVYRRVYALRSAAKRTVEYREVRLDEDAGGGG